jgi:hypothetical protein
LNGAVSPSRVATIPCTRMSTSPRPTPGPGMTRRRKRPSRNCGNSIRTSPSRAGPGSTGATIQPLTSNTRASSRAGARPVCRRANGRRIEPSRPRDGGRGSGGSVSSRERSNLTNEKPVSGGAGHFVRTGMMTFPRTLVPPKATPVSALTALLRRSLLARQLTAVHALIPFRIGPMLPPSSEARS